MKASLIELVWERAGQKCEYCRFPIECARLPFQVDHIIAEKHGGATTDSNLALSCYYCNSFKGPNIAGIDPFGDPDTAIQLFHPRKDHWASHFKWTGPELVGVTPSGRVTIAVLRINEPDAISFRELLLESGFVL